MNFNNNKPVNISNYLNIDELTEKVKKNMEIAQETELGDDFE